MSFIKRFHRIYWVHKYSGELPNKGQVGASHSVHSREVVHSSEVKDIHNISTIFGASKVSFVEKLFLLCQSEHSVYRGSSVDDYTGVNKETVGLKRGSREATLQGSWWYTHDQYY